MAKKRTKTSSRKPRADAQRNRSRILQVAKAEFTRAGADISLDGLARKAGVGAGTLYRHFPTRNALLEAVYRSEVEKLIEAEKEFASRLAPIAALREWLFLFIDYLAAKHLIVPALSTTGCGTSKLFESTGDQIKAAIHDLSDRAVKSGDLRPDIDPLDLLRAIIGISNVIADANWPDNARRMVEVLLMGGRPVL